MSAAQWLQGKEAPSTYDEVPFLPFGEGSEEDGQRDLDLGEASLAELKARAPDVPDCIPFRSRAEHGEPNSGSFTRTPLQRPAEVPLYGPLHGEGEYITHEQSEDFEAMYGAYESPAHYGSAEQYHNMNNENSEPHGSPDAFVMPGNWCASYAGQAFPDDGFQPPFHMSGAFDAFGDYGAQAHYANDAAFHSSQAPWRAPRLYRGPPYVPSPYYGGAVGTAWPRNFQPSRGAGPQPNWMRTPGSEGHEEGTCRPCHYIRAKDGCVKGADCDHCHLAHRKATSPKIHPATRRRCLTLVQRVFDAERVDNGCSKAEERLHEFLAVNEQLRGYAHSVMKSLKGGAVLRSVSMKL